MKPPSCPGSLLSRRHMLQIGGASLLGLSLPGLLRAQAQAHTHDRKRSDTGTLYRVDADRRWTAIDDGYGITNGPTFSPDARTLYVPKKLRAWSSTSPPRARSPSDAPTSSIARPIAYAP